jgi:hypothetical protein
VSLFEANPFALLQAQPNEVLHDLRAQPSIRGRGR